MSRIVLAVALACSLLVSCAKKDPFDQAFIEKDLRKHTAQEIHDAADRFTYDAPSDRRLSAKQIQDYIQVMKLTDRIRAVAERKANDQVDRASSAMTAAGRMGEALASIGSVRSYATAELRACLNLDVNPKEHYWVGQHVYDAMAIIDNEVRMENDIAEKKAIMDSEIDPALVTTKRHTYERAMDNRDRWLSSQDPAAVANAELVRKHRHELLALAP